MTVVEIDPRTDPRWRTLVSLDTERPGLFHDPRWLAAVADAYGFDVRAAIEERDVVASDGSVRRDLVMTGLAYVVLDDELGRRIAMPFSDACGPIGADPVGPTSALDLLAWFRAQGLPVAIRNRPPLLMDGSGWTPSKRARWHRLWLGTDQDGRTWWDRAAGPFRQGVRKAERAGLEVRPLNVEADGGVASFARLHRGLRRSKYGMLSQPEAFFAAIRDRFAPTDGWHPLGAFDGDRLVAATVYLRWGDELFYKFNASDPTALDARPNNLLVKAGAELAATLGCTTIDLGPSDDDQPGLVRFKSQTGAAMSEVTTWTWTPPGWEPDPSVARLKRTLGELTGLLVQPGVDDAVTHAAGDALYRWFA